MAYEWKKLEHSPEWNGPVKHRSCTDWPCLVIFAVLMTCWVGVGIYALTNGNMQVILAPTDSQGRRCGLDPEVIDEPYLVFFDITKCLGAEKCETPQVCREKCPSMNWASTAQWDGQNLEYIRENIICQNGIDVNTTTKEQFHDYIEANNCTKWVLQSEPVFQRCVPKNIPFDLVNHTMSESDLEDAHQFVSGGTAHTAAISTSGTVLGLLFAAVAVCFLYIFLMKRFAFEMVVLSIVILCPLISYLSYHFYARYLVENNTHFLTMAIMFAVMAGLIVLIPICLLKKIRSACQLIEEASNAVLSTTSSLLFPLFPWLLHLASIVYMLVVGIYLLTVETNDSGAIVLLFVIHAVGFIWLYCFITDLGEMILAGAFSTWYWTFKKVDVPSFTVSRSAWRTVRYHLGTVAFGSVLITICRSIRHILGAAKRHSRREGGLCCILCTACGVSCMSFVEVFLKFMNRHGYVICAVHGKGLVSSASYAHSLVGRSVLRVIILNNIVSWLLWLGKMGITAVMGTITYWCFTSTQYEIDYWRVPVMSVTVGSYLVASIFFSTYEVAVDTIFLCFLEDCERNDGSLSKPYYMSSQLRALLHKESSEPSDTSSTNVSAI